MTELNSVEEVFRACLELTQQNKIQAKCPMCEIRLSAEEAGENTCPTCGYLEDEIRFHPIIFN